MAVVSLYLVRHGVAAERGDEWPDDTKRPLVPRGIARLRRSVRGLQALGVKFDIVLTSPLVRARQTAEILAAGFSPRPPVHTIDSLAPGGAYASFLDDLGKHARGTAIACVGHEPDLGELAARLLRARGSIELKKGAICCIDLDSVPPSGPGHLKWLATPRMLRHLRA
jgi:phosphohistidine phosphatase